MNEKELLYLLNEQSKLNKELAAAVIRLSKEIKSIKAIQAIQWKSRKASEKFIYQVKQWFPQM